MPFVQLNRTFDDVSDEREVSSLAQYMLEEYHGVTTWERLLESRVIVVLAEGRAGKTEECKEQVKRINLEGGFAFFLELRDVAQHGFVNTLSSDQEDELKAWLEGDDEAVFFLDSVDECKLANQSLSAGLRSFAKSIKGAEKRTRVVITSRIIDWDWKQDSNAVKTLLQQLILEKSEDKGGNPVGNAGLDALETTNDSSKVFRIVGLHPLDRNRIKGFCKSRKLDDTEAFIKAIEQKGAWDLASRPMELDNLIGVWRRTGRVGTYGDLIKEHISEGLREENVHHRRATGIPQYKALQGAKALAAGLTFTKASGLLLSDAPDIVKERDDILEPKGILHDWNDQEIDALLDKPLFGELALGRIRLHRTIQEYLTAEWLFDLLATPGGRRAVNDLLFVKKFGVRVIPPTVNAIAGWIGGWDDRVRDLILEIEPENLITQGDPSLLDASVRSSVLVLFAKKFEGRDETGLSFDISALRRFKADDIEDTVLHLLDEYGNHEDIRELLLRIIWAQQLPGCAEAAIPFSKISRGNRYSQWLSIRIVAEAGNSEQKDEIYKTLMSDLERYDETVIGVFFEGYFPEWITINDVVTILHETGAPDKYHAGGLSYHLEQSINSLVQSDDALALLKVFVQMAQETPFLEVGSKMKISERFSWLEPIIKLLISRLLEILPPPELCNELLLEALDLTLRFRRLNIDEYGSLRKVDLNSQLNTKPALKKAHIWYQVEKKRVRLKEKGEELTRLWRVFLKYDLSVTDTDWLLEEVKSQKNDLYRRLAFDGLCEYRDSEGGLSTDQLSALAQKFPSLQSVLNDWTRPIKHDPEDLKWKLKARERERQEAEDEAGWKKEFRENIDKIRNLACFWEHNLSHIAQRYGTKESSSYGVKSTTEIVDSLGMEVSQAFEEGARKFWRLVTPLLECEYRSNKFGPMEVVGLSGLNLEALDDGWPASLSPEEAQIACRFSLIEMNGFPDWFPSLLKQFSKEIEPIVMKQIRADLALPDDDALPHTILNTLSYAHASVKCYFTPLIEKEILKNTPPNKRVLSSVLDILFDWDDLNVSALAGLARSRFSAEKDINGAVTWMAIWLNLDSLPAIGGLKKHLKSLGDEEQDQFVINVANRLSGGMDRTSQRKDASYLKLEALKEFIPLVYRHVRPEDDVEHRGSYSPDARDKAESFRGNLLGSLSQIPGKEAYKQILDLSELPQFQSRPHRLEVIAFNKLVQEADTPPWSSEMVREFPKSYFKTPSTPDELFVQGVRCLEDIKSELEDGDTSARSLWAKIEKESEVQVLLARQLRDLGAQRFVQVREEEVINGKFPDIRLHRPEFEGPTSIEVKIADNWSLKQLHAGLSTQLVGQYLRDAKSRHGIYLLVYRGDKKKWQAIDSKERLTFEGVLSDLQDLAKKMLKENQDVDCLEVIAINLSEPIEGE